MSTYNCHKLDRDCSKCYASTQIVCELEKAGHKVERIPLTKEQQEAFEKSSKDFQEWYRRRNPEFCSCGNKIKEYNLYINDVAKCEECFHEATKHWVFK